MTKSSNLYVRMDVHKESIDIALADDAGLQEVRHYGRIGGDLPALDQVIENPDRPRFPHIIHRP